MYENKMKKSVDYTPVKNSTGQTHSDFATNSIYSMQLKSSYNVANFKGIDFTKTSHRKESGEEKRSNSSIIQARTNTNSLKVIQCLRDKIVCKKSGNAEEKEDDYTINSRELWNILNSTNQDYASEQAHDPIHKPKEGYNDWYQTFVNIHKAPSGRQLRENEADSNIKVVLDGTEFRRDNEWNEQENKKLNYIYYPGDSYGSYPELSDLIGTAKNGSSQAQKIRHYIQSGVKVENKAAVSKDARNEEITMKQSILALFGSETTRAPRTFLSNMMLLDNMQAQIKPKKKLNLAKMMQRGGYRVKSSKIFRDRDDYPMTELQGGYSYAVENKRALVGGKAPMAGGNTLTLGRENEFREDNLVHAKEVSIFINWLSAQNLDCATMSKTEALAAINQLIMKRSNTYDYMNKGETAKEMIQPFLEPLRKAESSLQLAESEYQAAQNIQNTNEKQLAAKKSELLESKAQIAGVTNSISENKETISKELEAPIREKCQKLISKKCYLAGKDEINRISSLEDFKKFIIEQDSMKFFEKQYLLVNDTVGNQIKMVNKISFIKFLNNLKKEEVQDPTTMQEEFISIGELEGVLWQTPYEDAVAQNILTFGDAALDELKKEIRNIVQMILNGDTIGINEYCNPTLKTQIETECIPPFRDKIRDYQTQNEALNSQLQQLREGRKNLKREKREVGSVVHNPESKARLEELKKNWITAKKEYETIRKSITDIDPYYFP